MYDRRISEYATEQFKARQRKGEYIELVRNSRVVETRPGTIPAKSPFHLEIAIRKLQYALQLF